jgi:hypothetical protein
MGEMTTLPPNLSPTPWSAPHAMRWQGRNARKISWIGIHAHGAGKGDLPVHSIKPKDIEDSPRRLADAHMISAAPKLFLAALPALAFLEDETVGLSSDNWLCEIRDALRAALAHARGENGELRVPDVPQFNDLV